MKGRRVAKGREARDRRYEAAVRRQIRLVNSGNGRLFADPRECLRRGDTLDRFSTQGLVPHRFDPPNFTGAAVPANWCGYGGFNSAVSGDTGLFCGRLVDDLIHAANAEQLVAS